MSKGPVFLSCALAERRGQFAAAPWFKRLEDQLIGLLRLAGRGQKHPGHQILTTLVHSANQCGGCGQNFMLILGYNKAELLVSDDKVTNPTKDQQRSYQDAQALRRDDCALSCLEVPQVVTKVSLAIPCCFWQNCSFFFLSCNSLSSCWISGVNTLLLRLDSQPKGWVQQLRVPT